MGAARPWRSSPAVTPPPGSPRFPLVDSLRAIAVLLVLVYHVTLTTGAINDHVIGDLLSVLGTQGLVVFFMISGFLLYRPFAAAHAGGRPDPSVARYARRRVLRIVPAYWTALTVLAIVPGIVGVFTGDWWRYYLFLQVYSADATGRGIPVAWTLAVEVSFYALLPLWAIGSARLGAAFGPGRWLAAEAVMLGAAATVGIVIQVAAARLWVSNVLATTLLGESVWFAAGMALAVVSVDDHERATPRAGVALVRGHAGVCWTAAIASLLGVAAVLHTRGLLGIIASLQMRQPYGRTLGALALTLGFGVLLIAPAVLGDDRGGVPRRVLSWRPLALLGLISYGVYLYHLTLAEVLAERSDPTQFSMTGAGLDTRITHVITPALFVLTLAASVIVATLSYRLVELPFLRLKERRW